jgi:hypothetical protein
MVPQVVGTLRVPVVTVVGVVVVVPVVAVVVGTVPVQVPVGVVVGTAVEDGVVVVGVVAGVPCPQATAPQIAKPQQERIPRISASIQCQPSQG